MSWIGAAAGVLLVWLVSGLFGWREGGMVVLAAVAGAWIGTLHKRVAAIEAQWRERLVQIEARLRALQRADEQSAVPREEQRVAPAVTPAQAAMPKAIDKPAAVEPPARPVPAPVSPAAASARALEPDESSLPVTTSIAASVLAWFRGGNTIVRIAVVVLFFGVAFLLRYAAEHALVPIEVRVALVALGGLALAVIGWRLREKRRGYGLSLQGAGVGIVYLTLFAAMRLYQLVPPGLTFGLLAALAAVSALLAVRQDALPLAVLGFGGGFLAPVLTSTGAGNHVALFGYYLVLNLAIAWIARRQAWKLLNLVGFLFTFSIGALWGAKAYTSAHFATTEPFLVAHFGLYLWIAVQYTRQLVTANETSALRVPVVDGGLLFGVPIAAFGLQAAMLREEPLQLALSAAVLSAVYLAVGWRLWRVAGQRMVLLVEGLLALGVIFLILVTPLALDARWTGAAWAVQGAGIVWVGLRQKRWWAAGVGVLLQLVAAVALWSDAWRAPDAVPFANAVFVGAMLLAASALVTARLLQQRAGPDDDTSPTLRQAFTIGHLALLAIGLLHAIAGLTPEARAVGEGVVDDATAYIVPLAALVIALEAVRRRLAWPELRIASHAIMGWTLLLSLFGAYEMFPSVALTWGHYAARWGWIEVACLLGLGLWLLQRDEWPTRFEPVVLAWYAMLQGALFAWVLAAEHVARHHGWTPAAAVAVPITMALALLWCDRRGRWPVLGAWREFDLGLMRPLLVMLGLWVAVANAFSDASMAPLPYLPLVNPLDLAHGLIAILALRWWRRSGVGAQAVKIALGAAAFWWLNGLLVRSLHHWVGTPMWEQGAFDSGTVQTGFTILWTLTALGTMLLATRAAARSVWMVGAALLGVVLVKLFLVDLSQVGALMRIVSFLGVGGLMLVIGYLSPLPPAVQEKRA
jgi:uncharacterized membrane protein